MFLIFTEKGQSTRSTSQHTTLTQEEQHTSLQYKYVTEHKHQHINTLKFRNTHLHLWAWFGRRGERSHQGQRLSSSCSCVDGHRTTKPRNGEIWAAEREIQRGGEENNKLREGERFSEDTSV